MIQRELIPVTVVSFTAGKDEYGQKRQNGSTQRVVDMVVKIYQQTNTNDIRYIDVDLIGLTKDTTITDANQIIIGDNTYEVLQIIPSSRYTQVLMKKV